MRVDWCKWGSLHFHASPGKIFQIKYSDLIIKKIIAFIFKLVDYKFFTSFNMEVLIPIEVAKLILSNS